MFQQVFSLIGGLGFNFNNSATANPYSNFNSHNNSVAIIGAGAGGSSAAYHLANFTNNHVDITIFDQNDYVGGRVNTIQIDNETFELGGSIFVTVNSILFEAAEQFNLNVTDVQSPDGNNVSASIWDGREIVYNFPEGSSIWQGFNFIKDFGLSPLYASYHMKRAIGKFLKLYQEPFFPWSDLNQVVEAADLNPYIASNAKSWLSLNTSISNKFQDTLLQSLTRVNYAANLNHIHSLAAMVCLAAEDGVHQIQGGNNQIFQNWINSSNASVVLNHSVQTITKSHKGWLVDGQYFDYVILATPFEHSNIVIESGAESTQLIPKVPYVQLHVTFVLSANRLNGTYFGANDTSYGTILTTVSPPFAEPEFLSISHQSTTKNSNYVYKLFSYRELTTEKLNSIFGRDQSSTPQLQVFRKIWYSYPQMVPTISNFAKVELAPHLFYTSNIDPFISTMETNALSGKNIAKLIQQKLLV